MLPESPPQEATPAEGAAERKRRRWLARYVARRLLILIPLVFLVSVAAFTLTHAAPGGPIATLLENAPTSPEQIEAIKEKYKLGDPLPVQYWDWISGVAQGDFGRSILTNETVLNEITSRLWVTLSLNIAGIALAILVGVPLGVLAALRRGRFLDRALVTISVFFMSTPVFALGLFALYLFGFRAGLFPLFGPGEGLVDRIHHLALPAIVLGLAGMGFTMRLTRAAMLEQFDMDYVAFARARGLGSFHVTSRYAFRNALIPVTTAAGLLFTGLLTGSVLVETVFGLPGLGTLLVSAVTGGDFTMVQGLLLFIAAWIILVNIAVDVLYVFIDPRVEFDKARG
ncbi:ABC transporter permease [Gaiella sp.]|uniref:ABC transporter permease n=1 Tax=Gaiella sp. TaxID=2663207 RepID=UPI00326667E2